MKKTIFTAVAEGIYYIETPSGDQDVGITLIKGETPENTVLIDTGANDKAITKHLVPALKSLNMSARQIGNVVFTHFHIDNIGGLHALRKENPRIKVIVPKGCKESVLNPMLNIFKERDIFPMHNPPFQEVLGVFPDREMTYEEERGITEICGLRPIRVAGHAEGFCWYHTSTGTMICGDALQVNGNVFQGMAFYTDIAKYRATLKTLEGYSAEHLVCTRTMDGVSGIEHGADAFAMALKRCDECVKDNGVAIKAWLKSGVTDVERIATEISLENFRRVPDALTYAMQTVTAHIREEVFG